MNGLRCCLKIGFIILTDSLTMILTGKVNDHVFEGDLSIAHSGLERIKNTTISQLFNYFTYRSKHPLYKDEIKELTSYIRGYLICFEVKNQNCLYRSVNKNWELIKSGLKKTCILLKNVHDKVKHLPSHKKGYSKVFLKYNLKEFECASC